RRKRLPECILLQTGVAVANPLRIVAFQQLQCLNSTNAVFTIGDQVNVVTVLCQQANRGLEVPKEPEAAEGKQNFHVSWTNRYTLPSSHLQIGARNLKAVRFAYTIRKAPPDPADAGARSLWHGKWAGVLDWACR